MPAISYVATVYINVDGHPLQATMNSSRTDALEALLNSAVNSGTLSSALKKSNFSATAATAVQATRAARSTVLPVVCPVPPPTELLCASATARANAFRDVAIVFIVALGCLIVGFLAALTWVAASAQRASARASVTAARKSIPEMVLDSK